MDHIAHQPHDMKPADPVQDVGKGHEREQPEGHYHFRVGAARRQLENSGAGVEAVDRIHRQDQEHGGSIAGNAKRQDRDQVGPRYG